MSEGRRTFRVHPQMLRTSVANRFPYEAARKVQGPARMTYPELSRSPPVQACLFLCSVHVVSAPPLAATLRSWPRSCRQACRHAAPAQLFASSSGMAHYERLPRQGGGLGGSWGRAARGCSQRRPWGAGWRLRSRSLAALRSSYRWEGVKVLFVGCRWRLGVLRLSTTLHSSRVTSLRPAPPGRRPRRVRLHSQARTYARPRPLRPQGSDLLVLVEVYATWCGPCAMMGRTLEVRRARGRLSQLQDWNAVPAGLRARIQRPHRSCPVSLQLVGVRALSVCRRWRPRCGARSNLSRWGLWAAQCSSSASPLHQIPSRESLSAPHANMRQVQALHEQRGFAADTRSLAASLTAHPPPPPCRTHYPLTVCCRLP